MKVQNCLVDNAISNLLKSCSPLGIRTISKQEDFLVYPNPFTNKINIKISQQKVFYELINSAGQIIWTGKEIDKQDFSSITNGIYFLKTYSNNTVYISKLIKN